jgi:hypothetical protein
MDLSRQLRALRSWLAQRLRLKVIIALIFITALSVGLLWEAAGIPAYAQNLALNLGADLIGAIVVIFVVSPLITRAAQGRVREHRRLDYDWYTDQVFRASSDVQVLDTFSGLLDRPGTARFLRAAREAMNRHARVRILLLNPDSLAAEQRANELGASTGYAEVRREIMRNIHVLNRFARELDEPLRRRFETRLYSTSASVTIYRWDDRAMVSFLPIGRLSGEGTQLEVTTSSPLGTFVGERFDELWKHGKPIEDFVMLSFTLIADTGTIETYTTNFVRHLGDYYIAEPRILAHLALQRDGNLRVTIDNQPAGGTYGLEVLSSDTELHAQVMERYVEKYERQSHAFVHLRAATTSSAEE